MSVPKATIVAILLGFVEARFGVEQGPVQPVQALGAAGFGGPGVAETIAGSIPGALLAGAGPCAKVSRTAQCFFPNTQLTSGNNSSTLPIKSLMSSALTPRSSRLPLV